VRLPVKILLLGAGELGKEFVISAKRLGCEVIACDSYDGAPAQQMADSRETFDMLDPESLRQVIRKHKPSIIVPEIEAIRTEVLFEFEAAGLQVVPSARAVNLTMNRDKIRDLVSDELGVRTARFAYGESQEDCARIGQHMGYPLVIKPVMSSSGKGQSVLYSPTEISEGWRYACEGMRGDRQRVIIEEFIDFQYEITLLTVRTRLGETLFCPPIGHRQERGDYQESWQPVRILDHLLAKAQNVARIVTGNLGGVGIFGVELFITENDVIFSELSPRPHDTGMVTLVSQNLSEFDLHARSILGLPIPRIELYGPSASHVVLAADHGNRVDYSGVDAAMAVPGVDVRIFGKQTSRPFRRMAVCLARGDTIQEARERARQASKLISVTDTS
jgi:phosphoribosylglycinamide formyltransferase 2